MPLRISNYGNWEGERPDGHHPPACTCVACNEERHRQEAADVADVWDAMLRKRKASIANRILSVIRWGRTRN